MIDTAYIYAIVQYEVEIQQFQPISENSREVKSLQGWMVMPTYASWTTLSYTH